MERNETHQVDSQSPRPIKLDTHSRLHLSVRLRDKLAKLARWRIDPSLIEFPGDPPEFRGGNATVSQALLTFRSNGQGASGSPEDTAVERPDSNGQNSKSYNDTRESGDDGEGVGVHQDNHPDGDGSLRAKTGARRNSKTADAVPNPPSQPSKPKNVAVKKLKIDEYAGIERVLGLALRESEFLVELSHPNIIKMEGYVEDASSNIIWLVFPWEENGNLRDFLASGEWEIPERISLIYDVSKGVEYLHSKKPPIYHGDLKSLNVLVNSNYRAVITDFGSARHLENAESREQTNENETKLQSRPDLTADEENASLQASFCATTSTITLTGSKYTLRWAAPELLSEDRPTLASDIWSLGWIAYEVMTDSIPFHDVKKDTIVIRRVIQGDLPSVTDHARMSLIQELCSLMARCWIDNPNQRPNAKDCRKSLDWMPLMAPAPNRTINSEASKIRYAQLLVKLGSMYVRQGDYENASDCYNKSLAAYPASDRSEGRADALYGLADVYRHRQEISGAIKLFSEALDLYIGLGASKANSRARTLWALAAAYLSEPNEDKAYGLFSESLQIYTDLGDMQGRAYVLQGLADIKRSRGDYSEASTLSSEAIQINTEIGDRRGRAVNLWGLAEVHRLEREYDNAIKLYSEALQIARDIGDRSWRSCILSSLAGVHQLQGEYSTAVTLYTESLQVLSDFDNKHRRASVLWALAFTHYQQHHYNDAMSRYTEASKAYEEIGYPVWAAKALEKAAEIRKNLDESV